MEDQPEQDQPTRPAGYQAPAIVESATFEHVVLACTQNSSAIFECNPDEGGTLTS